MRTTSVICLSLSLINLGESYVRIIRKNVSTNFFAPKSTPISLSNERKREREREIEIGRLGAEGAKKCERENEGEV